MLLCFNNLKQTITSGESEVDVQSTSKSPPCKNISSFSFHFSSIHLKYIMDINGNIKNDTQLDHPSCLSISFHTILIINLFYKC